MLLYNRASSFADSHILVSFIYTIITVAALWCCSVHSYLFVIALACPHRVRHKRLCLSSPPSVATLISCNTECKVIILFTVLGLIVAQNVLVICVQSGVSAEESQGMKRKRG